MVFDILTFRPFSLSFSRQVRFFIFFKVLPLIISDEETVRDCFFMLSYVRQELFLRNPRFFSFLKKIGFFGKLVFLALCSGSRIPASIGSSNKNLGTPKVVLLVGHAFLCLLLIIMLFFPICEVSKASNLPLVNQKDTLKFRPFFTHF